MLDVVIVNWNAGDQLRNCVESILKYGTGLINRITVVDNNSSDGSEIFLENILEVTLIRTGANLGFGKACNIGASGSTSKYVLFINPDAAIFENTIFNALGFMQEVRNNKVGICGVQLLNQNGHVARSCSRLPSLAGFASHATGLAILFPSTGHAMSEWDHGETREVDQVIGAFFLVRRELFEALKGFDERFFLYFEEVDFSYRASLAGWKSYFLTNTQAFHAGGGTSNQVKTLRLFYSLRSRLLYVFKHFSFLSIFHILLVTLALELVSRSVLAVLRQSGGNLRETWCAYVMLYRWIFKTILGGRRW